MYLQAYESYQGMNFKKASELFAKYAKVAKKASALDGTALMMQKRHSELEVLSSEMMFWAQVASSTWSIRPRASGMECGTRRMSPESLGSQEVAAACRLKRMPSSEIGCEKVFSAGLHGQSSRLLLVLLA